jgi:hypothetical protein
MMTEITRAVTPADLVDLLRAAQSATTAWERDGSVEAQPVAFRFAHGAYRIGVMPGLLREGIEVAVLIDGGPWYFDLRGVRVRGRLASCAGETAGELEWFDVKPEREVAWHYGRMRER